MLCQDGYHFWLKSQYYSDEYDSCTMFDEEDEEEGGEAAGGDEGGEGGEGEEGAESDEGGKAVEGEEGAERDEFAESEEIRMDFSDEEDEPDNSTHFNSTPVLHPLHSRHL